MHYSEPLEFNELLNGYLRESLNPQELALFFKLASRPENCEILAASFAQALEGGLPDLSSAAEKQEAWSKLHAKMGAKPRRVVDMRIAMRWVAILVCLLGATAASYFFNQSKNGSQTANIKSAIKTSAWLTADHLGATLFLGGGDSIALNSQDKGIIAKQDGIQILQSGGSIRYSGNSSQSTFNEIRTEGGKLWRAILPDQTVVWLNGHSSIKYPLQFAADTRSVEMTGEVYFEVTHHADYPFQVKTAGYTVEDIGTTFNIKSMADDTASIATLIEGSARVTLNSQQATLTAGQQSSVTKDKTEIHIVKNANLADVLAWKNGFFYFQNASLPDVMKQLSDWYHVGVVYEGRGRKEQFSGQIDKTISLSDVLQGLRQPGVRFSLDSNNRQITVIQQ